MSASASTAIKAIGDARILPVLRTSSAAEAVAWGRAVLSAGVPVVELTATTPEWDVALRTLRSDAPDAVFGLGTVVDAEVAHRAAQLGADFLVSPYPAPGVRAATAIPLLEGGLTPGELAAAVAAGGVAKLFPAHAVGAQYVRSVLAVMPSARLVPTGGIALEDVDEWLACGAFAVGVGSDLLRGGDIRRRLAEAGLA